MSGSEEGAHLHNVTGVVKAEKVDGPDGGEFAIDLGTLKSKAASPAKART